jgi:hypothetical protein
MPKKMLYVLVFKFKGWTYYVQKINGSYKLNGLSNNAIKYYDPLKAASEAVRIGVKIGRRLAMVKIEVNE